MCILSDISFRFSLSLHCGGGLRPADKQDPWQLVGTGVSAGLISCQPRQRETTQAFHS